MTEQPRPLAMACQSDKRPSAAAAHLVQAGKTDVRVPRGGMLAWRGHWRLTLR